LGKENPNRGAPKGAKEAKVKPQQARKAIDVRRDEAMNPTDVAEALHESLKQDDVENGGKEVGAPSAASRVIFATLGEGMFGDDYDHSAATGREIDDDILECKHAIEPGPRGGQALREGLE